MRWLTFAFQNTLRNRRRSIVTIAVAALGTAAILLASGFALSTYRSLEQAAARSTGHLIVGTPEQFTKDEDTPLQYGLDNATELAARLAADPDVRHVLPRISFSGLVSNGDKSTVMLATGVDPDHEFAVKGPFLSMLSGDVLASDAAQAEVMLGEGLARSLKAKPGSGLTLLASTTDGALNALDVDGQGRVLDRRARHRQAHRLHRHRDRAKAPQHQARVDARRLPEQHGRRPPARASGSPPRTPS